MVHPAHAQPPTHAHGQGRVELVARHGEQRTAPDLAIERGGIGGSGARSVPAGHRGPGLVDAALTPRSVRIWAAIARSRPSGTRGGGRRKRASKPPRGAATTITTPRPAA